jgi:adenine-specific DNA-methyltransferase
MSTPLKNQITALPSYLGGKRRLLAWLGTTLEQAYPHWNQSTFIDLFMGGGAVSLWAKAQGFEKVIANDISLRSQVLAEAFLTNTRIQISREEALSLTQPLPEAPGFIEKTYCPHVFSTRHAQALDRGFYWARQHPNPTKRALLLTLMWHLTTDFVAFATSLGNSNRPFAEALDGVRGWDGMNPKRFNDGSLKRLCQPAWKNLETKRERVNRGVFGGALVEVYQEDALTLLPKLQGDILYLDPPYAGTANYERSNEVLDALLAAEKLTERTSVSPFSKSTDVLHEIFVRAQHIPVWLISYGNQQLNLDGLVAMVKAHADGRVVKGFSKHYRHLPHISKNTGNQEMLVIAYPKRGV